MGHVIGIDLGTVNSCVATIVDGVPAVIHDPEGRALTPSIYAVSATGSPLVGHAAQAQLDQNRQNTIFAVKRLIGLRFDSPEVKLAAKKLPYKIVSAANGDAWVEINESPTSPEEISAQILVRLKEVAEHHFGEKVTNAVITVPAHFNDAQRQATKDAGRIAGLNVMRVLNEPTAAALAFGLASYKQGVYEKRTVGSKRVVTERIVSVFDLGGGTFDVSILALRDGVFEVLSTHGDTYLGGEDFDLEIVKYAIEQFRARTGQDISQNRDVLQKLKSLAKEAKHRLSTFPKAEIQISYVTAREHLQLELDRKTFEKIVEPILQRLAGPCLMALQDAGLAAADVDDVILVGGMSRVPAVKRLCRQIFGKEPIESMDADEAVGLGAAIQAGILQGLLKGVSLNDVTSLSLGIETQGGLVHTLLPRNTAIPSKVSEVFTTSSPNQPQVSIHLLQGESDFAPENISLGRFELTGVRPAPRGVPRISVTLEVDTDGIVHLSARDLDTGEAQQIDIVASSGLNESEIDELLRENAAVAAHQDRVEERESSAASMNELPEVLPVNVAHDLKSLIFVTQFRLDSEGKGFRGEPRRLLEERLLKARGVLGTHGLHDEIVLQMIAELRLSVQQLEDYLETM